MNNLHGLVGIGKNRREIAINTGDDVATFDGVVIGGVALVFKNAAGTTDTHRRDLGVHPVAGSIRRRQQGGKGAEGAANQIQHGAWGVIGGHRILLHQ